MGTRSKKDCSPTVDYMSWNPLDMTATELAAFDIPRVGDRTLAGLNRGGQTVNVPIADRRSKLWLYLQRPELLDGLGITGGNRADARDHQRLFKAVQP
jgi:hypothetical protein